MDPETKERFEQVLKEQGLLSPAGKYFPWIFLGSFVVLIELILLFQRPKSFQYTMVIAVRVQPDKDAEETLVTVDIEGKKVTMQLQDRLVWPQKGQTACIPNRTRAVFKISTYSVDLDVICAG